MGNQKTRFYKELVSAVNEILYADWAPIGSAGSLPKDEYEAYAAKIVSMLISGASKEEIAGRLLDLETRMIGTPVSIKDAHWTSERIFALKDMQ